MSVQHSLLAEDRSRLTCLTLEPGLRGATVTAVNNVIGVAALLSSRNSRHRGLLPGFIVTGNEKK